MFFIQAKEQSHMNSAPYHHLPFLLNNSPTPTMNANSISVPPIDMNGVSYVALDNAQPRMKVGFIETHPNTTCPISWAGAHNIEILARTIHRLIIPPCTIRHSKTYCKHLSNYRFP